jgi:hypothetical protein
MAKKATKKAVSTKKAASANKKAVSKRRVRRAWSRSDLAALKKHSKAKTPVKKIAKELKRTEGSLRQKALILGLSLGHRR